MLKEHYEFIVNHNSSDVGELDPDLIKRVIERKPAAFNKYMEVYKFEKDKVKDNMSNPHLEYCLHYADSINRDDAFSFKNIVGLNEEKDEVGRFNEIAELMYSNPNFPYGYNVDAYNRHTLIMKKRHEDIKSGKVQIPNFFSERKIGLNEMRKYIDERDNNLNVPKPTVMGKTLLLTRAVPRDLFINWHLEKVKFGMQYMINFTFLNKFDNVLHPMSYFIKHHYDTIFKTDTGDLTYPTERSNLYTWLMISTFIREYQNNVKFKFFEKFVKYDIICFNVMDIPYSDEFIENFMTALLDFQKFAPYVYIKDLSGRGYSQYQRYSFYDELRVSRIDVT